MSSETNDIQLFAHVLTYLKASELRNARVLSKRLNNIITGHPRLLWTKNSLRIRIRPCESTSDVDQWENVQSHRLITKYNCPNFHLVKTNLLSPGAIQFFQSSACQNMRHLKLTKCQIEADKLLPVLSCVSTTLEHLEIRGFHNIEACQYNRQRSRTGSPIKLPCLKTLILNSRKASNTIPRRLLRDILCSTSNLETVRLVGWNAKTAANLIRVLHYFPQVNLDKLCFLEIACFIDVNTSVAEQYRFINQMEGIHMDCLRELTICFDQPPCGIAEDLVERFTGSVAIMIEGSATSLEVLKLLNCPINNQVLRVGIQNYPRLRELDTRGSFVSNIEADLIYQSQLTRRFSSNTSRSQNSNYSSASTAALTDVSQTNSSPRIFGMSDEVRPRVQSYTLACAGFVALCGIHQLVASAFGESYTGRQIEIGIHSLIVMWFLKGNEIRDLLRNR